MSKGNTWSDEIEDGAFKRVVSSFRDTVSSDPENPYQPESGRYHLYVAWACPWAHRTLLTRALKGLEDAISVSFVGPLLDEDGWGFTEKHSLGLEGNTPDHIFGKDLLKEVYLHAEPGYDGRITVPVLFDKKTEKIVNNESAEIIIMLNNEFNQFAKNPELDVYPEDLREEIEEVNEWIYDGINNGVYKCGFATKQEPYEESFHTLFESLDRVEDILSKRKYVAGERLTTADIRLFPTLIRFDPVYHGHFKCNKKKIIEYPNLWNYTKAFYQIPGVSDTFNILQTKYHYYYSHTSINPTRVVAIGPDYDYNEPHNRDELFPSTQ
eukprot:TRINITY_DN1765_c0_g1_i1.p1 TRINITY_DN1765_c0_g1~~TRINITY_DN1765_c0_g1_i1.p1  ORF type:complete len:355 (+),score=78.78 TRINITY_DN1765_c0_g1_i1:96-1067(+)